MRNKIIGIVGVLLLTGCAPKGNRDFGEKLRQPIRATRILDLTHELHSEMPSWPDKQGVSLARKVDYNRGYRQFELTVSGHAGTHVDAPAHFIKGGRTISDLALTDTVLPIVKIDVRESVVKDSNYQVSLEDIYAWEKENKFIKSGSLVVIDTGWHKRFNDPKAYLNADSYGEMHFPGCSVEAAQFLLERGVVGIGIDTPSLDHGESIAFETHKLILGADRFQIENLANLSYLPAKGATAMISLLPIKDGTQAQARVVALY